MKSRNAFTMIELVFVIVVLGILASIAIPRLSATRDDAEISKGIATVAAIRSGIVALRQQRLLTGDPSYPSQAELNSGGGFAITGAGSGVLTYAVDQGSGRGQWSGMTYHYGSGKSCTFTYTQATGKFEAGSGSCDPFE